MLLALLTALISLILLGCQSDGKNGKTDVEISKVSISRSRGFGKVNSDFMTVYKNEEALTLFENVISNAVKEPGVVDMPKPEFDLQVIYTDGTSQGYHLWVGEKGQRSTLMNIDDTHAIYSISNEMTNQLIDLFQNRDLL